MTESGVCGWHENVKIVNRYAHLHITKADCIYRNQLLTFVRPPRIGIDFRKNKNKRGHRFIPNMDVGDLLRMIQILKLLKHRKLASAIERRHNAYRFHIAPTGKRKIIFDVKDDRITIIYEPYWRKAMKVKRKQLENFITRLKETKKVYLSVITEWDKTGKVPEKYRHYIKNR